MTLRTAPNPNMPLKTGNGNSLTWKNLSNMANLCCGVLFLGWRLMTGDPGKCQEVQELPGDPDQTGVQRLQVCQHGKQCERTGQESAGSSPLLRKKCFTMRSRFQDCSDQWFFTFQQKYEKDYSTFWNWNVALTKWYSFSQIFDVIYSTRMHCRCYVFSLEWHRLQFLFKEILEVFVFLSWSGLRSPSPDRPSLVALTHSLRTHNFRKT